MPADFIVQLGRVAEIIDTRVDVVVKKFAFDIYSGITQRNPVDTGYSRAAWNIGVDQPDDTLPGVYRKGATVPAPNPSDAVSKLANVDVRESLIYITNAVHYVPYLEGGSSKKAPAGMVLVTVEALTSEIDQLIQQAVAENPL